MSTCVANTSTAKPALSFIKILDPLSPRDFFGIHWQREFTAIRGPRQKLHGLFGWATLDHILVEHKMKPPQFRVFRAGNALDPRSYLTFRGKGDTETDTGRLRRELSAGGTVVVDRVDEMHEPLKRLAVGMERALHSRVWANTYATWGTERGFDIHRDSHDVFVLQISGCKHWTVFKPKSGRRAPSPSPEEDPAKHGLVFDETIGEGDVLYIPEGWWHVAHPIAGPSLHITLGVNAISADDFIRWIAEELRSDLGSVNVPILESEGAKTSFIRAIESEITRVLNEGVVDRFIMHLDKSITNRPEINLQATVGMNAASLAAEHRVRLTWPRPLRIYTGADGQIQLHMPSGRRLQLNNEQAAFLVELEDGEDHLLHSDRVDVASNADAQIIVELIDEGVIAIAA